MITQRIADNIYEVSADMKLVKVEEKILKFQMKVPARIYANQYLMDRIKNDKSIDQITNVACLPGIRKHVIAMSDAHQGYGFCIISEEVKYQDTESGNIQIDITAFL